MTITLLPLLLASSNVTHAQDHEVSLGTGTIATQDMNWDKVHYSSTVPGTGITLGTRLNDDINLLVGVQTGTVGSRTYIDTDSEQEWVAWDDPSFNIAATVDQYAVGARWRLDWTPRLSSSFTGSAVAAHGRLRMDEDIEMEGSEVEVKYVSVVPGLSAGTGIEYTPFQNLDNAVLFNLGFEVGYTYLLPFNFQDKNSSSQPLDIGKLDMNGVFVRWSVGARF